jgi:hypothetical protein
VQGLEKQFDLLIEIGFYQDYQKWKDTKVTEWAWTYYQLKARYSLTDTLQLFFKNIIYINLCMIYDPHVQYSMLSDHAAYHVLYSCSISLNIGQEIDYLRFSPWFFNMK